jgi:hypothetical protein
VRSVARPVPRQAHKHKNNLTRQEIFTGNH